MILKIVSLVETLLLSVTSIDLTGSCCCRVRIGARLEAGTGD